MAFAETSAKDTASSVVSAVTGLGVFSIFIGLVGAAAMIYGAVHLITGLFNFVRSINSENPADRKKGLDELIMGFLLFAFGSTVIYNIGITDLLNF